MYFMASSFGMVAYETNGSGRDRQWHDRGMEPGARIDAFVGAIRARLA
jgi:hypothetical protein